MRGLSPQHRNHQRQPEEQIAGDKQQPGHEVSIPHQRTIGIRQRAVHDRAAKLASQLPDLELAPVQTRYDGQLLTFRLRFRLPLTLEVQHFALPASE